MSLLQVSAATYGQRVTLSEKNISLKKVFKEIRNQTGYDFMYDAGIMKSVHPIDVDLRNSSLVNALTACLYGQNLTFEIKDKSVIIKSKLPEPATAPQLPLSGIILDENDIPVIGASIKIKGTPGRATVSNKEGRFVIIPVSENDIIVISYIGYNSQEIKVKGVKSPLTIKLVIEENNMKDVVITGTGITRNKNSFTGATASYTGEQLRAVGNQNIIQGLRALDPSFIQIENNQFGSNPNVLPNIEIRGKTSITSSLQDQFASDPNQPLFILDGFETSLRTIVDLNQNRIGSVTILKDAASTAMYGSKASNGVVVIETVKPRQGQMNLNYSSDLNVEMPDLSGYNMMNAAEKLEFERLSGRYTYLGSVVVPAYQRNLDSLYNVHLMEVTRGVNTYWLNVPLRTGFSQRHSIYADGGDNTLRYGVGVTYKKTAGAMKGSGREDWAGNIDLTYRRGRFNFSNKLYINGYKADESPYGSFATFVNTNPYFRKDNPNSRYLEDSFDYNMSSYVVSNPLYNASLNSINDTKNVAIQNNLQMIIDLSNEFKIQAAVQVQKGTTTALNFLSPLNTEFDNTNIFEKGSYRNSKTDNFNYNGYLMLTYGKVFAGAHSVTANIRSELRDNDNENITFTAVGFPASSNGNPNFAYSYKPNSRPATALSKTRTNAILASANYAYLGKYLADFSFRYDGSTAFGSNKKYSPYLSGGLGWSVHNEEFMKEVSWINTLKLYANMGTTGNQNFASVSSISTYGYDSYINLYGQGVMLNSLGNPNLRWQNSVQTSVGTDMVLFNNRLSINLNAYQKKTDPLVVAIDLPSSTGISSFPINVGLLDTKGLEAMVKYSPIYRPENRIVWTIGVTGTSYISKYDGFSNKLASLNTKSQTNKSLIRYKDGYSPQDIWAVPSKGIDPGTGMEVFEKANGQYTFIYDANDIQKVGNTQPKVEGVFSNTFSYKGFNFNMSLRYILGRDVFNRALYEKVENISMKALANNQDKRALYDRWKKPGDISRFKGIDLLGSTPMSSRFVQTESMLSGESVSFGYNFQTQKWLSRFGLSALRMNAYMNDIFRLSSVRSERGIEYPFARSVSFSLNASF